MFRTLHAKGRNDGGHLTSDAHPAARCRKIRHRLRPLPRGIESLRPLVPLILFLLRGDNTVHSLKRTILLLNLLISFFSDRLNNVISLF